MASRADALQRAIGFHAAGRLPEAEQAYRRILEENPWHPDALHLLGVVAHQSQRHELAVQYIGQAIVGNATIPVYHNNLGEAYRALGRVSEARGCYEQALELDPACALAHFHLGLLSYELGQPAEAQHHYERAAALEPDHALTHNNLGNALRAQGEQAESVTAYEKALACDPNYGLARLNLCDTLIALARLDEAIEHLETALQRGGPSAEVHLKLGCAYAASEDWDRAIRCFEEALRLEPDFAQARCGLGNALWARGDAAAAAVVLEEAVRRHPEHAETLANYARLLESTGRMEASRELVERASRITSGAAGFQPDAAESPEASAQPPDDTQCPARGPILCINASHQHRCIFIHIPKNAGTSIKRVLDMPGGGHYPWRHYATDFPQLWREYTSFAVVRNPWDRMVSAYHHARMKKSHWQNELTGLHGDYELLVDKSFEECVTILCRQRERLRHYSWVNQAHFVLGPEPSDKTVMVDAVLRFETIAEDFNELCRKLRIDCEPLPALNDSPRSRDYRSYYNDETRHMIEQVYQVDIDAFGYSF